MTEKQGRAREISRREREMRIELIQLEMASAVRVLGGEGSALVQNNVAARATRLPVTVVERLRWKKIKRVPADIADSVREALERHNQESLNRAKHEAFVAHKRAEILAERLMEVDPDFYGPEINRLRLSASGKRNGDDLASGEYLK